jgi:cysteinyl-tRNA synthetase
MFGTHYRKQLNFADESLDASREAVRRVGAFKERLDTARGGTPALAGGGGGGRAGAARGLVR